MFFFLPPGVIEVPVRLKKTQTLDDKCKGYLNVGLKTSLIFGIVVMLWFKVKSHSQWVLGTEVVQQNWLTETRICLYRAALGSACESVWHTLSWSNAQLNAPKELGCSLNPLKVNYKWYSLHRCSLKGCIHTDTQELCPDDSFHSISSVFPPGFIMWVRQNSGLRSNLYEIVT